MSDDVPATPTLHLLCGKVAAGKSTLARQLSAAAALGAAGRDPVERGRLAVAPLSR
jgi:hypothetical protein